MSIRPLLPAAVLLAVLAPCEQAAFAAAGAKATQPASAPIPIRMVVVTAFEIGADTGDKAGELQAWAQEFPTTLPFPGGDRPLRYDAARGLLVVNTGMGTNRASSAIMALGTDPRFDFSRAYWLVTAIAGVNPNTASIGSAAWIGDIVDTDFGYAIDPREIPADWATGIFPLDRKRPYEGPRGDAQYNLFPLNKGLRDWAFRLTADTRLADPPVLGQIRAGYTAYPMAQCPPRVMTGDQATGQSFWHGKLFNDHVEKWVAYWTGRQASFVMTAMEDSGTALALDRLHKMGKADAARLMVLRTGANYSTPAEGKTAAESLAAESSELSALQPSLDAAHTIGKRVVMEITGNWPRYRDTVPSATPAPALARAGCKAGG